MLRLVTWNLDGLDDRYLDVRAEAACLSLLLRPDPPEVVLLQEVVARTFHAHLRPHFTHAGYSVVPATPPDQEYFVVACLRAPLQMAGAFSRRFGATRYGRELLGFHAQVGGQELLVLTGHLDSLASGRRERARQVDEIAATMASQRGPAVFGGDTNLREDEPVAGVDDAWKQVGSPKAERATWFPRERGSPGLRFDRVWLHGPVRARSFRRFGGTGLDEAGGMRISDHLGVEVELELKGT